MGILGWIMGGADDEATDDAVLQALVMDGVASDLYAEVIAAGHRDGNYNPTLEQARGAMRARGIDDLGDGERRQVFRALWGR